MQVSSTLFAPVVIWTVIVTDNGDAAAMLPDFAFVALYKEITNWVAIRLRRMHVVDSVQQIDEGAAHAGVFGELTDATCDFVFFGTVILLFVGVVIEHWGGLSDVVAATACPSRWRLGRVVGRVILRL